MTRAIELIEKLALRPHPERGFYAESYRSSLSVDLSGSHHGGPRSAATAIYFLLSAEQPASYLHRLKSDELFHLYEGGPLDVLLLKDGAARVLRLGLDVARGDRPQVTIPAGTWFGTELVGGASHVLIGCTVAPGFEFGDFELAEGPELAAAYPAEAERIGRMVRPRPLPPGSDELCMHGAAWDQQQGRYACAFCSGPVNRTMKLG